MKKGLFKVVSLVLVLSILVASVFVLCSCNDDSNPDFFSEDKHFAIDFSYMNIMGTEMNLEDIEFIVDAVLDQENTEFVFTKDGKFHFQITTLEGAASMLSLILTPEFLTEFDLKGSINSFVEPLFPGFRQKLIVEKDVAGAFGLLQKSMGLGVRGLDLTDAGVIEVVDYISTNEALPGNLVSKLPADTVLQIYFDQPYRLVTETTYAGDTMNMVYFGGEVAHNDKTQPYGIFQLTNAADGSMLLTFRLEVANITLRLKEV